VSLTLREIIGTRPNDVDAVRAEFVDRTGHSWNAPTPPELARGSRLSVVLPTRDRAYCIRAVLDALSAQRTDGWFEVIVVDDGSVDGTSEIVQNHPIVTTYVRSDDSHGAATARNIGTVLAQGDSVLYVDADMVLPAGLLADFGARCRSDAVLVGFREAIPAEAGGSLALADLPQRRPRLANDYRARFQTRAGEALWYSGRVLPDAVLEVGGFEPTFSRRGWGFEDTHLGAKLIATGLTVLPLRQATGFHVYLPLRPETARKRQAWDATLRIYQELLDRPMPTGERERLEHEVTEALAHCQVTRLVK
jgi:glycosyltransferase involved in cell wall biosynthesis